MMKIDVLESLRTSENSFIKLCATLFFLGIIFLGEKKMSFCLIPAIFLLTPERERKKFEVAFVAFYLRRSNRRSMTKRSKEENDTYSVSSKSQ